MQSESIRAVRSSILECLLFGRSLRALLFCSLGLSTASAQVSASLSGTVTDQSGAVVPGANVSAKNRDTGAERSTLTDAAGFYQFSSLPVGEYQVRGGKTGFAEEVTHRCSFARRTERQREYGATCRRIEPAGYG